MNDTAVRPMLNKPLAVMYLRVSTKDQAARGGEAEGFSIPAQRDACMRKAEALGVQLVDEFVDAGESARSANRPELKRMLSFVQEKGINTVIVHKVDRLARNRVDDVEVNLALSKAGARLVSCSENIDETPSGMLLHGIMSSIAEFYSRNLANEVNKGMAQKAKTGGTVTRAPLGYRNVRSTDDLGREVRTIAVDPSRAPLISLAFREYAKAETTLEPLAKRLSAMGLTTAATPKRPSTTITGERLHKVLTNRYYIGEVTYRGVTYPGRHEALTTEETFERVQQVLARNKVGEKTRDHPHYLKGSVFCGNCGSRLIISHAKNRHGEVYEYFMCSGRHAKRTDCLFRAVEVGLVEQKVEELYRFVRLSAEAKETIRRKLTTEFAALDVGRQDDEERLTKQRAVLVGKERKLLEAHYADAISLELLASEQQSIRSQLLEIDARLAALSMGEAMRDANLATALDLAERCYDAYGQASDGVRRQMNQAFFERILVTGERDVTGELQEPFRALLSPALRRQDDSEPSLVHAKPGAEGLQDQKQKGKEKPWSGHLPGQGLNKAFLVELRVSGFTT